MSISIRLYAVFVKDIHRYRWIPSEKVTPNPPVLLVSDIEVYPIRSIYCPLHTFMVELAGLEPATIR